MAKGKAPAFQFYPMDFILDTMGWPPEHVGAHIRLMSYQWINGGVPDDLSAIQDITGLRGKRMDKFTALLERKYPVSESGERHNPRLERSRKEKQDYIEQQADSGKAGAAKRWGHHSKPTNSPSKTDGETIALQSSPSTSNQKQKPKPTAGRAAPMPHDFKVTPDHRYWALERGLPSPDDHIEHFRQFWLSNGKKKLDWNATFRVWLINSKEKYGAANGRKANSNNKATERFNSNVEAIAKGFGLGNSAGDDPHDSQLAELQCVAGNGERLEGRVAQDERPIRVIDASGDSDPVHPGAKRISGDSGNDS